MDKTPFTLLIASVLAFAAVGANAESPEFVAKQRAALAEQTQDRGFGPQSPRDIDAKTGDNTVVSSHAPPYSWMNLCNIHFHKNAEHKGGQFTRYAGPGDGRGHNSGYQYSGELSAQERMPVAQKICPGPYGSLLPGDTIEVHYVHSTAQVDPNPTLGACLHGGKVDNGVVNNPQLRVEAQVLVLVNDDQALDFTKLTAHEQRGPYHQALHIPDDTGEPVQYSGSITGPGYNEKGAPFKVTWSVRPEVAKVNIHSVGAWCKSNTYQEKYAHGVRNLVTNPNLLSRIK